MISFPKILQLGDIRITDALKDGTVEITEKVDGSMFGFGQLENGDVQYRSKGQVFTNPDKLFKPAVEGLNDGPHWPRFVKPGEWVFGETLASPHHNTLSYERVPKRNLILFGLWNGKWALYEELVVMSNALCYEAVPLLYRGPMPTLAKLDELIQTPSVLGGGPVEGVVIRHTTAWWAGFGEPLPVYCKYVRADFKEKNNSAWAGANASGESKVQLILQQYRTEARWQKAVQHLQESGALKGAMQDMPLLIKEVRSDTLDECKEEIKEELFNAVRKDLEKVLTIGLPEWYKQKLASAAC